MRRALSLPLLASMVVAVFGQTDQEVASRGAVLELAGAFANDGFEVRDSIYSATLTKDSPVLVQVNLYAGDTYWFMAASADPAQKLAVALFDEKGQPVEFKPFSDGHRAAANFSPKTSGPYYIRVSERQGNPAVFCLTYSYK